MSFLHPLEVGMNVGPTSIVAGASVAGAGAAGAAAVATSNAMQLMEKKLLKK